MRTAFPLIVILVACSTGSGEELPRPEQLQHFQPGSVEMTWSAEGWGLRAGTTLLKQFGRRNSEAAQALRLIRDLGLTERGVIGSPAPVLEYWLAQGQAPTGLIRGQRILPLDPATLRVDKADGQWCLCDGPRALFNFGYARQDAEQALAVLRKYSFTRLILLGEGVPTMMVFLAEPNTATFHQRHSLAPLSMPTLATTRTTNFKPAAEVKTLTQNKEWSAIQTYIPPSIPPLHDNRSNEATHWAAPGVQVVPGVNDRLLRTPFDHRQVVVQRAPDGWVLNVGARVLARFGADEQAARRAVRAIQHYRFNELVQVGSPTPVCRIFTISGQIALGELFGVPSQPIQIDQVKLQLVEGRQALVQGTEVLLSLGDRPEDGQQLLGWLQRHKPDHLCRLPTADGPGIYYFTRR